MSTHVDVGPVEALTAALDEVGFAVEILSFHQTSTAGGSGSDAVTLVEFRRGERLGWAAGQHRSVLTSSLSAVMRATTG